MQPRSSPKAPPQAKVAEAQLADQRSSTAMAFSEDQPNTQQVRYGGSRLPPPVLISFKDATTGARKVSMRSNHSWRQRTVNFTGSLDLPLEEDGFEPSVPLGGGGGSDDAVSGLERFSRFKTSKRPGQDRRGCGGQAAKLSNPVSSSRESPSVPRALRLRWLNSG